MDKAQYLEQVSKSLAGISARLRPRAFANPSTFEASRQQDSAKRAAEQVKPSVAKLLARIEALRASSAPLADAERQDLDRQIEEIMALFKTIR